MRRLSTIFRKRRPADLPSGTLTFLLTDIEASTGLWETEPAGMERAVPRHVEIIQLAVEAHDGVLVRERGEGDSTFSVFTNATNAVAASLEAQRALHSEPWPAGAGLRVRFALHTGDARYADGEYTAPAINRCARIRALTSGGQTLLSQRTAELVADALPPEAALVDLGTHRLRDLSRPERIAQLAHPELPDAFPALRSLDVTPHNLPVQLTSFIGRDEEINRVHKLLQTTRMLTVMGTGGLGKTRLALQVGAEAVDRFADGVWFVDLASLVDGSLVASAASSALSLRDDAGRTPEETLLAHLGDRRALLIFDNCEHLVGAVTELATAILRSCPEVSILATSRTNLNVAGATSWSLPPMELPSGDQPSTEELASYESVRLFCERAALRNPEFALSHANARDVLEICRRLDGIPLAVELAAAQSAVLSPSEIARRLEDRFRLLTGGPDDDPRHATLRATLDWSFGLLDAAERLLLGRLATFAGGFSLGAVEAICSGDGLAREEVLDVLRALVDSSLVLSVEAPDEVRFAMLETVHEYAAEQRRASQDAHPTEARHLAWYLELAEGAAEAEGPDEAVVLNRLEREHDNFRAALDRALEGNVIDGASLATWLRGFWQSRGHWSEGRLRLEQLLGKVDAGSELGAAVETAVGRIAIQQGDLTSARARLDRAVETWRREGIARGIADALLALGDVLALQGDHDAALAAREEARDLAEEAGESALLRRALNDLAVSAARSGEYARAADAFDRLVSSTRRDGSRGALVGPLFNLGVCRMSLGDPGAAEDAFEEAALIARELGNRELEAAALSGLGDVAEDRLDLDRAATLLEQSATIQRDLNDEMGLANSLLRLGELRRHSGDLDAALAFLDESLGLWRTIGHADGIAGTLSVLGRVLRGRGRQGEAWAAQTEAIAIAAKGDRKRILAVCLEGLGGLLIDRGDALRAAMCLGSAQALRDQMRVTVPPAERAAYDRDVAALERALGVDTESSLQRGRELSIAEAVDLALSE